MRLWLVRHAQPLVAPGVCYGATDMPADVDATSQAAQALVSNLPMYLPICCSPLQRCEQMARAISALRPDLISKTEPRIAEMNFGQWEGQLWSAIPKAEIDVWTADFADLRVGLNGESVRSFMQRVDGALSQWRTSGQDALWVTHAGVVRAARLLLAGVACPVRADQWPQQGPGFGELEVLTLGTLSGALN